MVLNYKDKIIHFLKQPLLYIILICVFVQVIIYGTVPRSKTFSDSSTYIQALEEINVLEGKVDERRTPVYPYFIKMIRNIGGEENLLNNIAIVQKILFIIIVILFYFSVKTIVKNKIISSIVTLMFGISPFVILWNVAILTESLSIMEMVVLSLLTLTYLNKPNYALAVSNGIVILIMIMTRPSFIYLLPIYLLFWVLRFFLEKEEGKKAIIGGTSCIICGVIIIGYCVLVKNKTGNFSLTSISNTNNVISAISSGAYKNASNKEIIEAIDNAKAREKDISAFKINRELKNNYSTEELKEFAKSSMLSKKYIKYLINKTTSLGKENIGTIYVKSDKLDNVYMVLGNVTLPIIFNIVYIMIGVSIIYLIWKLIKHKQINYIIAFCISLITANIFTLIVGAPGEGQRLFAPSISLVLIFVAYILDNAATKIHYIYNSRTNNVNSTR